MLAPLTILLLGATPMADPRPLPAQPAPRVEAPRELAKDLMPPVRLEAAGKPIDAEKIGHAAPFVGDFFGDGKQHLLVGQFADGIVKVYRNVGTSAKPKLEAGFTLKVGKEDARVPTG
jgi:hypothetical protein